MPKTYYLDSCIWRDYYENRSDTFRPIGEWALKLIQAIIKDGYFILYSDMVIEELEIRYGKEEMKRIFEIAGRFLVKADISASQAKEAAILCKQRKVAFGDALHAILARDNNSVLITRDRHFMELVDIAEIKKPEDLV